MKTIDHTNVIYDKNTGRILVLETNNTWVIPPGYELAHFENGVEPVIFTDEDGKAYLKPNTMLITEL